MTGKQNSLTLRFQCLQESMRVSNTLFVQSVKWFIKNQYLGIFHDSLRNAKTLTHAKRIFSDVFFVVGLQPNNTNHFINTFFRYIATECSK